MQFTLHDNLAVKATTEITNNENLPAELVFSALLGAGSSAFSSQIEVAYPLGGKEQTNLFISAIAGSGIGKSRSLHDAIKPFLDFQNDHLKSYEEQHKEYECDMEIHLEELNQIRKSKIDPESKKIKLYLHKSKQPQPPTKWLFLLQDATPLGIIEQAEKLPSVSIMTAEGRQFYNPRNQTEMDKTCANWSGEPITYTRKDRHYNITNTPFTYTIFIQEVAFQKFMDKKGDDFRDSGFAARTNFVYVPYTPPVDKHQSPETTNIFVSELQERIRKALATMKLKFESRDESKICLQFSGEAVQKWHAINNEIIEQMNLNNPYARFHGAVDHAARLMQNITRIAAILHRFNSDEHSISLDTLNQATLIGAYYSDTFRFLFVRPPQAEQDAEMLNIWLNQYRGNNFRSFIRKNFVRQNGPNSLRQKERLENALWILYQNGLARAFMDGQTTWLNLLPGCQPDILPEDLRSNPKPAIAHV